MNHHEPRYGEADVRCAYCGKQLRTREDRNEPCPIIAALAGTIRPAQTRRENDPNTNRERYYRECAAMMCSHCNEGERPQLQIAFGGYCHIWKRGNGHSRCSAAPIWKCLDTQVAAPEDRPCTCHPDDNPPRPCPKKYAYSECVDAARVALEGGALGMDHLKPKDVPGVMQDVARAVLEKFEALQPKQRERIAACLKGNEFAQDQWTKGYCAGIMAALTAFDDADLAARGPK